MSRPNELPQRAQRVGIVQRADRLNDMAEEHRAARGQRIQHCARDADELHDVLRTIGDLNAAEIGARCTSAREAPGWLDELVASRRSIALRIAGEKRRIAVEAAARHRDALGTAMPARVPETLLDPLADAGARTRAVGPARARSPASAGGGWAGAAACGSYEGWVTRCLADEAATLPPDPQPGDLSATAREVRDAVPAGGAMFFRHIVETIG